jgi:hypothetical protein
MALQYLKPEDCDKYGSHYDSFTCEPAPGGGNECVGQGSGGQYSDCKQCLQKCSNNPGGGTHNPNPPSPGPSPGNPKPNPKPNPVQTPFMKTMAGKITIGVGSVAALALIIFLVMKMSSKRSSFSSEPIMWRR